MRAQGGGCAAAEGLGRTRTPSPFRRPPLLQVDVQPPLRFSQTPAGEAGKGTPGLLLQRLTTREPSDDQLEVAIKAMDEALAMEPR